MKNVQEVNEKLEKLERVERELAEGAWEYVILQHAFKEVRQENERLKLLLDPDAMTATIRSCLDTMSALQLNLASEQARKCCAEQIAAFILDKDIQLIQPD